MYIHIYDLYGSFILNVYQMNICLYGNKGAHNTCIPLYIIYMLLEVIAMVRSLGRLLTIATSNRYFAQHQGYLSVTIILAFV